MQTIAICSSKGGTGKSTVTANLGLAIVSIGHRVAFMDIDIEGPNLQRALGLETAPFDVDTERRKFIPYRGDGWQLFTLASLWGEAPLLWKGEDTEVEVAGEKETLAGTGKWTLVRQLLGGILWDRPDYLLLDLPPTSGEIIQSLFTALQGSLSGAVLVCQPTPMAVDDIIKNIGLLNHYSVPLYGLVENMSCFVAPDTGKRYSPIFVSGQMNLKEFCRQKHVPYLGEVPLCPDAERLKPIYLELAKELLGAKPQQLWKKGLLHDIGLRAKVEIAKKMFGGSNE